MEHVRVYTLADSFTISLIFTIIGILLRISHGNINETIYVISYKLRIKVKVD